MILNASGDVTMAPILVDWIYVLQTICRNCNKKFPVTE